MTFVVGKLYKMPARRTSAAGAAQMRNCRQYMGEMKMPASDRQWA